MAQADLSDLRIVQGTLPTVVDMFGDRFLDPNPQVPAVPVVETKRSTAIPAQTVEPPDTPVEIEFLPKQVMAEGPGNEAWYREQCKENDALRLKQNLAKFNTWDKLQESERIQFRDVFKLRELWKGVATGIKLDAHPSTFSVEQQKAVVIVLSNWIADERAKEQQVRARDHNGTFNHQQPKEDGKK